MKTINFPQFLDIFSKNKKIKEKKQENKPEKIIIDYREKNSLVASYLIKEGLEIIKVSNMEEVIKEVF